MTSPAGWLVTGAASGMGLATAQAFAASGSAVVLADLDEDALRRAVDQLTGTGRQAIALRCDVTDEDQVAKEIRAAVFVAGVLAAAARGKPEMALAAVDRLDDKLAGYHAYHATRADLLRGLGRSRQSRAAYDRAIELAGNTVETAYLTRRRDQPRCDPAQRLGRAVIGGFALINATGRSRPSPRTGVPCPVRGHRGRGGGAAGRRGRRTAGVTGAPAVAVGQWAVCSSSSNGSATTSAPGST